MGEIVEVGVGEIVLEGEKPKVILPKEMKPILQIFMKGVKKCKVFYDKQEDYIYIVPTKNGEEKETENTIKPGKMYGKYGKPLKLHEAIAVVIYKNNNKPMKPPEILEKIEIYDLYRKKDGKFPEITQIHARISKYPNFFNRTGKGIILTKEGIELAKKVMDEI